MNFLDMLNLQHIPDVKMPAAQRKPEFQIMNELPGKLGGYDCDICRNKGIVYFMTEDDYMSCKPCECMPKRDTYFRMKQSGLGEVLDRYRLDNYNADAPFQRIVLAKAKQFLVDKARAFYIGGQSGAGKTHICTAVVGELIKHGMDSVYMLWRDESVKLKYYINDPAYDLMMEKYKRAPVLYIDDLFKTTDGSRPTNADVTIAFELLNARYLCSNTITLISSEMHLDNIIDIDEAVGGRIKEMAGAYVCNIAYDRARNYRLRSSK